MKESFGIVEVIGMSAAIKCADEMVKNAYIEIVRLEKTGSGLVAILFKGELASVQHAMELGVERAIFLGSLHGAKVIARPAEGIFSHSPPIEGDKNE